MNTLHLHLDYTPADPDPYSFQNDLTPHEHAHKFDPPVDLTTPTNLAVPFLRNFKQINRQRGQVQKLRVKASEERRGPWKDAKRQLFASGSEVLKVLKNLELPDDTREKLSSSVENLQNAVMEVEKHDLEYDEVDGKLVPAEYKLEKSERSLYVQMLGLESQIETEDISTTAPIVLDMPWSPHGIDQGASIQTPDLLAYGAGIGAIGDAAQLKEQGAAPRHPEIEDQLDIRMRDARSSREPSQGIKPEDHENLDVLAPAPSTMLASTSEAKPAEPQQKNAAEIQILNWSAHLSRMHTYLGKLEAEHAVLQEEVERRTTVGVPLDSYSQQRLAAYPQDRGMLWKEIARIENEIASLQSLVGHGEKYVSRASEALFHLDQFDTVTTYDTRPDLHLDDDEDKNGSDLDTRNPKAERFAVRTGDVWPIANNVWENFEAWLLKISSAAQSNKRSMNAYVTFWILTCIEASWGSCLRFAHHNSLDTQKYTSDLGLIENYLFRKWFGPGVAEEMPQHNVARSMRTSLLPSEDNRSRKERPQHVTGSQWSTRPQNGKGLATRGSATASPAPTRRTELLRTNGLNDGLRSSAMQEDDTPHLPGESMENAEVTTSRRTTAGRAESPPLMPRPSSNRSRLSRGQSVVLLQRELQHEESLQELA